MKQTTEETQAANQVLPAVLAAIAADPPRLAAILDQQPEPLIAFTADRIILSANPAAERFFGYGRNELADRATDQLIPERFRQPGAPPQPATPDVTTVEIPGLLRDGTELPTSWAFASTRTSQGLIFVLVVRDLARLATEIDALRRTDGRYRSLLLASTTIVWVANADGELVEPLPTWEAYTGQTSEQQRGTGWTTAIHAADREPILRAWMDAVKAGSDVFRAQGRIWSARHQSWRAFQTRAVPVRRPDGTIVEWVGALTDVQDAVDAQDRLASREREMEHRFRAIYENALDGILLTDDSLRVVDANPAACRLLARTRESIVGMPAAELMPPGDRSRDAELMGEFRATGILTGEGPILLPDGTVRRAEFGAVANVWPGAHLSIFRDIEDRKRAEEAQSFLDEASRLLAASLEYDDTLSSVARLAVPRIADWAAVDMLESDTLESDSCFRRVAVAHVEPAKIALANQLWDRQRPSIQDPTGVGAVVRTGQPELIELVTDEMLVTALAGQPDLLDLIRGLGLRSAMTVPLSARGKVIGAISFVSAESRRRYSTSDLAFAQELSRRATYAVENALFVRDLRAANRTKDMFLRRAEHLQATAAQLVRAESVEAIARAFESGEPQSPVAALAWSLYLRSGDQLRLAAATTVIRGSLQSWDAIPLSAPTPLAEAARTDTPFWFTDAGQMAARFPEVAPNTLGAGVGARVALPLRAGGKVIGVIGLMFEGPRALDLDERDYLTAVANLWGQALHRAQLAQAEREAIRRALDAETLATRKKDEFLAMLGHELRNPLAPILTATSLLRMRGDATNRELDILDRQARHLVRLVDDLLDISRITSGKLTLNRTRVDVAAVIAQAVESTGPMFEEKRIRLSFQVADATLTVDGDRERLVQVLSNLLVNAAKFTPAGKSVRVTGAQEGGQAVVSVRDEGVGVDPELVPRVFDLFSQGKQTADRRNGGLGLGLAIAHSIVTAHQGRIVLTSDGADRGTTVTIRLPLASAVSADAPANARDGETVRSTARHRVLIVDDNQDSAEMLAEFLGEVGYDCYVAGDARRALALLGEVLPAAAILDIGLPDIDGHELAREIRRTLADRAPKLIALTGYAQDSDRKLALEAGFADHLAKPVEMSQLTAKLSGLLATTEAPP